MWKDAMVSVQAKRIGTRAQVERALDAIVAQAAGEVALAGMNLTTGEEIARNAERSMPTASVFKLPLLVEVFRQAEAGALDLDERVTLRAEDVVMGSGILRDFGPGLQPTVRDLAMMMSSSATTALRTYCSTVLVVRSGSTRRCVSWGYRRSSSTGESSSVRSPRTAVWPRRRRET